MNHDKTELFQGCVDIQPDTSFESISIITPSSKGVILFTDQNDAPIQLLIAANIRRTIRAKLFTEEPQQNKKRTDLSAIVRKIYYRQCFCDFQTALWHYRTAREIFPDTYKEHIIFSNPSWLRIDPSAKWPDFNITDNPIADGKLIFGPFDSRAACTIYHDAVIEAFSLCKHTRCIDNPEKAKSCPYLQMGLCDGVCVGKIPKEKYLNRINQAISAADNCDLIIKALNDKMISLSRQTKFEQAQKIKETLEEFKRRQKSFRWIKELSQLSVLHIDFSEKIKVKGRKRKVQTFAAFVIKAGHIYQLENFEISDADKIIQTAKCIKPLPKQSISPRQIKEQLALFSYYLYKSNRPGVWLDLNTEITPENITEAIAALSEN